MRYLVIRERHTKEAIGLVRLPDELVVGSVYPGPDQRRLIAIVNNITKSEYTSLEALGVLPIYDWQRRSNIIVPPGNAIVDTFNTEYFSSCPAGAIVKDYA